ncbi:MAG: hypothetical protein HQL25_03360 [Candidatus Omnitrophica bacterium]|nr:hypothetical protein [Candidatus Omnitrophota bacterium]
MPVPKLYLDVNIILDVAFERGSDHGPAEEILSLIEQGEAKGFLSAASYPILYYFLRKHSDVKKANQFLNNLRKLTKTVDLTDEIIGRALLVIGDLEDAIQNVSAEVCEADFILTRDKEGFKNSVIPAFSPAEYISGK